MSLINDMLRDLEARKHAAHKRGEGAAVAGVAAATDNDGRPPAATVPLLHGGRDGTSHVGLDERVRRRGRWLLPVYALTLVGLSVALYFAVAGPGGLLRRDAFSRAVPAPVPASTPVAAVAAAVATAAAPAVAATPRLVMIGVDEARGPALTLRLRFAPALTSPLRVNVVDRRVQLGSQGAQVGSLESPSPLLTDWRSEQSGADWHASFAWDGRVEVSLSPVLGDDASQGWVVRLLPAAEPAVAVAAVNASAPTASRQLAAPSAPTPAAAPAAPLPVPTAGAVKPASPASTSVTSSGAARDADTLYADAWRLQQAGQLGEAIGRLDRLLEGEPLHARARELLARLWVRSGRADRAMQVLNDGLAALPGQPAWVELQARLLDGSGHRSDAIALLDAQGSPQRLSHQALRGVLDTQEGHFADAATAYRLAIALEPAQPRWWLGLAVALDNLGDAAAARSAYQGALDTGQLDRNGEHFARERLAALPDGAKP